MAVYQTNAHQVVECSLTTRFRTLAFAGQVVKLSSPEGPNNMLSVVALR